MAQVDKLHVSGSSYNIAPNTEATINKTSSDASSPSSWTDVDVLASNDTVGNFFQKASKMFANTRWMKKILGTGSISIGGKTNVTEALSYLNNNKIDTSKITSSGTVSDASYVASAALTKSLTDSVTSLNDAIQATDYTANVAYTTAGNAQRDAGEALSLADDINTLLRSGNYHYIMRSRQSAGPEWVPNNSEGVWPFTELPSVEFDDGAFHVIYLPIESKEEIINSSITDWEGIIWIFYDGFEIDSIYLQKSKLFSRCPEYFYIYNESANIQYVWFESTSEKSYILQFSMDSSMKYSSQYEFTVISNTLSRGHKIALGPNECVYFRGMNSDGFSDGLGRYLHLCSEDVIGCGGNIMTLLDMTGERIDVPTNGFERFFDSSNIKSASRLQLPALMVNNGGYSEMFHNATSLVTPPALPAQILGSSAYDSMFSECINLERLSNINATYIGYYGCRDMYKNSGVRVSNNTAGGIYKIRYRIPPESLDVIFDSSWSAGMFNGTKGPFTGNPNRYTVYYTDREPIR